MKQIALGVHMYANDYNGFIPYPAGLAACTVILWEGSGGANLYSGLGHLLAGWRANGRGRYIDGPANVRCPSLRSFSGSWTYNNNFNISTKFEVSGQRCFTNYAWNSSGWVYNPTPYAAGRLDRLDKSGYILLCDAWYPGGGLGFWNHPGHNSGIPDGLNVVFYDGSARWVNDSAHRIWNTDPTYGNYMSYRDFWNWNRNNLP
ncbi:MAG: hypothetical protein NC911_00045 [Candidatus Omnitrophica bacterium]|nr:hypothetical protein [Candidatus Omnitrophota bacterium]